MSRNWLRIVWLGFLALSAGGSCPATALAAEAGVGFLVSPAAARRLDAESDMACEAAEKLVSATVFLPAAAGRFVDHQGRDVSLDRFRVIWCYQGETGQQTGPVFDPQTVEALRQFVGNGHGLLLSGKAAALVEPLGIDTLRAPPVRVGQDYAQAGLVPLAARHAAFQGLDLDRGTVWMSNAAYPAFTEFRLLSQPAKGMLLARTPGGPDCPLVEYQTGPGRVIVLGWRLDPLYGHAPIGSRRSFERLATNLVRYLGDVHAWQPLAMQADGRPRGITAEPGVTPAQWRSLELAIRDLRETFGERYPRGEEFLRRLETLQRLQERGDATERGNGPLTPDSSPRSTGARGECPVEQFQGLQAEALLANPLLDFQRLLIVKRDAKKLGLPANYLGNSSLPPTGYDNQIVVLSPVRPEGQRTTLYQPAHGEFVGDVRLAYDAQQLMFSMPNAAGRWRVFEINIDGSGLHELPLINEPDVDNYDACYLPDGRIIFSSTACFAGIPCVNGEGHVANLYLRDTSGKIRQLTVEQDHDWCPTVLNNGRVLYLRWEYTDLPHAFSRILFHMNPDGTEQMEYYGSNSYWPAAMFYARP
ncbi:MAG: hypothetical protein NTY19_22260, partial [Planctomycetota bacterium]|nr:hypothetical protein [Planctomycetota bacterium]